MSNFPTDYDDDTTLPVVNNNITEIGGDAINALRDAAFNIEQNIGIGAAGSSGTLANRLGVSIMPDGTINPSAITALGLVSAVTGVFDSDVNPNAAIIETKLKLDHRTQDLFNYIRDLSNDINIGVGWISTVGIKLEPHLLGAIYRHTLDQIDVIANPDLFLKNKFRTSRDNSDSFRLVDDINDEFLAHQWADGSPFGTIADVTTNNGSTYPSNYAHTASGIFLDTNRFSTIPQTAQDLQAFAQFIDSSSIFLYGTRIQNLYSNGISKVSRSSNLAIDGYGPSLVPPTTAIAYLQNTGMSSSPLDDIDNGDDIIEFKPSSADRTSFSFDEKFALVKPGDILRINYGTIEVSFIVKEKKYISDIDPLNNVYIIRIAGKNLFATSTASARIDKSLVNSNKFGVLALGSAQIVNGGTNALTSPAMPSLVVGTPRGAMALGLGFNPDQFDSTHYNLYLALYPTGIPVDGYNNPPVLPAIDVTGNAGATPGKYTLESIVEATNRAFRRPGYNYRFIAYSYKGDFGIMLADSYNNAAFSIVSAVVSSDGTYDITATNLNLPNNVVDVQQPNPPVLPIDPLGFGASGSGVASPPYMTSYGSSAAALLPTKLFTALKRNNYYVDGTERDKLNLEIGQTLDDYGDGYWAATADGYSPGAGKMEFTYKIPLDLSTSNLKIGKTLVVQGPGKINSGRFVITDITVDCTDGYTFLTVYDGVHATALSPTSLAQLTTGTEVRIYFNSDSVSFNQESATDFSSFTPFKRHFEVYTDSQANTFTHERGRTYIGTLPNIPVNGVPLVGGPNAQNFDIVRISPKLRGYQFGTVTKITLFIVSYSSTTGLYSGYLCTTSDYLTYTRLGPTVNGKIGEVTRFYDESQIDYVDIFLDLDSGQGNLTNSPIDIQLFPTLALDDQIMMIGTCQLNDTTRTVSFLRDERQFGNTSEKEFSTSALDFISAPQRLLDTNGVIRGFDTTDQNDYNAGKINLTGGTALVNGKFIQMNPQTVSLPPVLESDGGFFPINWAICVNDKGEYQPIPLLDKFGPSDATSGGTGSTQRIFTAYNIVTSIVYTLDAVTFANLANNRKDLTVLYVAKSSVSVGPVFTVSVYDVRKYIYNQSDNIQFTLVPTNSDLPDTVGHFRSASSLVSWLNMYGMASPTVKVKGVFTTNQLNFESIRNGLVLEGDGAVFNVTANSGIRIKENTTIRNITFNYNPTVIPTGNINGYTGCILGDATGFADGSKFLKNLAVEDCVFSSTTADHPPFICLRLGAGLVVNNDSLDGIIDGVTIRGNKFNDTTDHPAAIAILNTYEDQTDTLYWYAPTVANVIIEDNICNKNQIFFLASTFEVTNTGLSVDSPGLNCFSVIIRNNKVGYIAYTSSGNKFYNINASISNNLSNDSIVIENNNCVAIVSPVDQTGKVPLNYIGSSRNTYQHIPGTGNVRISYNVLSFISTVNRRAISNTLPASLIINDNKLEATNYANTIKAIFNFDVSPTVWSGQTFGVAIYVDHISLYTTESAVGTIIENNIINNTSGIVFDPTFTNHYYEGGILTTVPCIVSGNIISGFAGMAKSGADPLTFGIMGQMNVFAPYNPNTAGPSTPLFAKASNNFIYRGGDAGAEFKSYVSGFSEVTDNFFDSSHKDNTFPADSSLVLVTGASRGDYRNTNEIYTIEIRAQDTGKVLGANNLTFNIGVDNTLLGFLEDLAAPAATGNPYRSGVDAVAVSIDAVRYTTKDNLTAGDTTDGQLHVNSGTGIKKAWVVSLDEIIPNDAHLYSVTTNCKISGGAGNKIAFLALVSEGAAGYDYSYAYSTPFNFTSSGLSPVNAIAIDTPVYPYTAIGDIPLSKTNITVIMDATAINATFFFSNLVIKYIY